MAPSADRAVDNLPLEVSKQPSKQQNGTFDQLVELDIKDIELGDKVLRTFRCLIADLCQQFNGGHPGSAMGMAAIGVALWKYVMKYSPENPNFLNRDRFVLSNGHTCLFQYTFLHLVGYKNMTFEQLKSYHSDKYDSICPGHPEIEHEGIEVTTGPLGQGIANAVGLAMASKHLGATYNKPDYPVFDNTTWCIIGDACLQEGVALEAISLAGHWKLDNLVVIYDNNQITCDGSVDLCNNEDINAKMIACGWNVIDVLDGNHDIEGIVKTFITAKSNKDKPTFINIRTIIGIGSAAQGTSPTHGAALGVEDVKQIKRRNGMDETQHFVVSKDVYDFFREAKPRGRQLEADWNKLVESYAAAHPDTYAEFALRVEGKTTDDWTKYIPAKVDLPTSPTPSRKSSGLVMNPLAQNIKNFMVGTADLSPSVNMIWKDKVDFQHHDLKTSCGINGNYAGRYVHWGIREHAMASISNGLSAYNRGTIIPVTSSFFMFYIYAAPGIRMAALQGLQQIHVATHDSIGTGEDGPTHQPIALANFYRAMPNLLYIRPADSEETAGAYTAALKAKHSPSIISLSRQALPQYPDLTRREGVQKGAYVLIEKEDADVTLIGVGAEMTFAIETAKVLESKYKLKVRVVSFPCQRLFDQQPIEYKREVLRYWSKAPRVVIEAYAVTGWERYADAGYSMHSFGKSLPGKDAYKYYGFNENVIAPKVKNLVDEVRRYGLECLRGEFRDLNDVVRE